MLIMQSRGEDGNISTNAINPYMEHTWTNDWPRNYKYLVTINTWSRGENEGHVMKTTAHFSSSLYLQFLDNYE